MRQSELFSKTFKENPKDEKSVNAQLLIRAGYIDKLSSGILFNSSFRAESDKKDRKNCQRRNG